jgi:hypothetical protein
MIKVKKKVNSDKYFGTNGVCVCVYIYILHEHACCMDTRACILRDVRHVRMI